MSKKRREKKLRDRIKSLAKKQTPHKQKPASQTAMPLTNRLPFMGGAPFGELKPPKGFRSIPMMQATLKFAESIMELMENGTVKNMNDALQIGMQIWNFTLPTVMVELKKSRAEIVEQIHTTLKMETQEAEEFFDRMVARKEYLFPQNIQPKGSMTMFMRKEVEYLITAFDESLLGLAAEPVPADFDDQEMLDALRRMDKNIKDRVQYDEWEDHFFYMQKACCHRYARWLNAKGIPDEYSNQFPYCVEIYLNFLYQYGEGEVRDVSPYALKGFFLDFLMRKVMMKPPEYTYWPPALRLFYTFLFEKDYLDDPRPMIDLLDDIEPDFIEFVKKRS